MKPLKSVNIYGIGVRGISHEKDRKNGLSRFCQRLRFHAFLRYLHMGNPLSKEECKEVKCVIQEIIHGEKTSRLEKLCECCVYE